MPFEPNYLRIYWSDLREIFSLVEIDWKWSISHAFCYRSRSVAVVTNFSARLRKFAHTPPSFFALAFRSGWEDRNAVGSVNTGWFKGRKIRDRKNEAPKMPGPENAFRLVCNITYTTREHFEHNCHGPSYSGPAFIGVPTGSSKWWRWSHCMLSLFSTVPHFRSFAVMSYDALVHCVTD